MSLAGWLNAAWMVANDLFGLVGVRGNAANVRTQRVTLFRRRQTQGVHGAIVVARGPSLARPRGTPQRYRCRRATICSSFTTGFICSKYNSLIGRSESSSRLAGGVGNLYLRARQDDQRHPGFGEFFIQPSDVGQNVAPQQPAVAVAVRCGDEVGDAVPDAEPGHCQRLVQGRGPVIDPR
jgi:hypothetical protein